MDIKEKIIEHAYQLFSQFGMRSITMDDIAKGLGISKKTIYQYFNDKDEIVLRSTERHLQNEYGQFSAIGANASNAIEEIFEISVCIRKNIANVNPSILFELQKYYPKAWDMYMDFKEKVFKQSIFLTLERGRREGFFRPEIDIEILTILRLEQIHMSFDQNIYPSSKFDFKEIHNQFFEHFIYGVLTEKGRQIYDETKSKNS